MKKQDLSFVISSILVVVLLVLLAFKLIDLPVAGLILSLTILIRYFMVSGSIRLYISGILGGISGVFFIDKYFMPGLDGKIFLFLFIFASIFLMFFIKKRYPLILMISLTLYSIGFYNLFEKIYSWVGIWLFLIFMSLSLYILYLIFYKKNNLEWPKKIAIGLFIIAILLAVFMGFASSRFKIIRGINYIWPVILMLFVIGYLYKKISGKN